MDVTSMGDMRAPAPESVVDTEMDGASMGEVPAQTVSVTQSDFMDGFPGNPDALCVRGYNLTKLI